jgi:HEAT repeat protein
MPLMRGLVHRHLTAPQSVHTLRTSLRIGETVERKWDGEGFVIVQGRMPQKIVLNDNDAGDKLYYGFKPGRRDCVYAAAGEECQTFDAETTPEHFAEALFPGSKNVACSRNVGGSALLHPDKKDAMAELIYRIASPYVAVEGHVEAILAKADQSDICRILMSRDGLRWQPVFERKEVGEDKVKIDLGRAAREQGRPHVYTAYTYFIKVELSSARNEKGVGLRGLKVVAFREFNKRTLPNLLPGENILKISAERIAAGQALELHVRYRVDGKPMSVTRTTSRFPHYFKIDVPGVTSRVLKNYDHDFNNDALQMESIRLSLVSSGAGEDASLPEAEAEAKFRQSCPNPQLAEMVVKKEVGTLDARPPRDRAGEELDPYETDVMQVSGFFPQSRAVWTDKEKFAKLVETFKTGKTVERWVAAEDLGNYPEAIDLLCQALPNADSDLTLHIVKALAQIKDKKAVAPLLEKWKRAPAGAPGMRYIPDALAAIGDASVVPALVKPLKACRFDFRSHIVYALGILGGPTAEESLGDLAKNDPFPAVREQAEDALKKLRNRQRR